jgi:hypothetical protein
MSSRRGDPHGKLSPRHGGGSLQNKAAMAEDLK